MAGAAQIGVSDCAGNRIVYVDDLALKRADGLLGRYYGCEYCDGDYKTMQRNSPRKKTKTDSPDLFVAKSGLRVRRISPESSDLHLISCSGSALGADHPEGKPLLLPHDGGHNPHFM